MDSVDGHKVPEESDIRREAERVKRAMMEQPGLSNIRTVIDMKEFIFSIKGDFRNVAALDKALNTMPRTLSRNRQNLDKIPSVTNYSFGGNVFHRHAPADRAPDDYQKMQPKDRQTLESGNYICILRFPRTIKEYSNRRARLSGTGKAIMLRSSVKSLVNGSSSISNKVILE